MRKTGEMRKSLLAAICLMAFALSAFSAADWRNGERVPLWPEGRMPDAQAHQIGAMTDEASKDEAWRSAHRMPYIEWFEAPAADKRIGACMILVSGGSYQVCCDVGLIKMWKERFTDLGFQCVNLVYRTPRPKGLPIYQSAWEDGQRAVRLVRQDAKKRGFDPEKIGVIGMSAGGHLTVMLATNSQSPAYERIDAVDDIPCHVNWAIANAPAYNTLGGATGNPSPQDGTTVAAPKINPCFAFDEKTCPICFHHGGIDPYSPNGSTLTYRELRKRKIPSELHLYADKKHGAHGFDRALEFLRQMNYDGRLGPQTDRRAVTGNYTERRFVEQIWPDGRMPDVQTNQTTAPFIEWFLPKKRTTGAIQVVLPGGGYSHCNVKGEGLPVAEYLNAKGMTVAIVTYRTPRPQGLPKHQTAWQDAQRAIRLVRSRAPSLGLDPSRIGTMGFSAGGHLALMTALSSKTAAYAPVDEIDKLSCTVQWSCPIYPAYALTDGADSCNKNGGNGDEDVFVPEFAFDAGTPPMCFVHGDADAIAAMASVKCWERLRTMGIQSDLHTLATRGHCFQFKASDGTGSCTWLDQIWDFLTRKGFNK